MNSPLRELLAPHNKDLAPLEIAGVGCNHLVGPLAKAVGGDFAERFPYTVRHELVAHQWPSTNAMYEVWVCWSMMMLARDIAAHESN